MLCPFTSPCPPPLRALTFLLLKLQLFKGKIFFCTAFLWDLDLEKTWFQSRLYDIPAVWLWAIALSIERESLTITQKHNISVWVMNEWEKCLWYSWGICVCMRVCRHVCVCTYLMYYVEFMYVPRCAHIHIMCACVPVHAHIECSGVYMCYICTRVCVFILPSVCFYHIFKMLSS